MSLRLDRDGPLAVLTIDHPPLNLFDHELMEELAVAVDALHADPPRGVLLRAEGKVVSGGVDVGAVFDGLGAQAASRLWGRWLAVVHRIEQLPCPTVFAAHALTLTAAFEIALACDLIVAAQSARFGLVERVVGLTPSMGGTQRLVERAGPGRARELVMTGALFGAPELERWNVVNRVYPDETFAADALAFAQDLANGPTLAHAVTKQVVRATLDGGVLRADYAVQKLSGDLFDTEDLQQAVRSFLDRGPGHATFDGR
jgi:enoyl-CoA hydratase/carnithine racemase